MITCGACGSAVREGNTFCTSCGARMAGGDGSGTVPGPGSDAVPADLFTEYLIWNRKIPLITNPYLVLQCLLIPFGIGIVLGVCFALVAGEITFLTLFVLLGLGLGILFLFVLLGLHLTTGGLDTEFFISDQGIAHSAGRTTRALNRASAGGSALLGSMGGTGAGMIAISQEENILHWEDVRYIMVFPRVRSVVFRSRYLINPVVLYCTEENFDAVRAMIKKYAPPIAAQRI